MKKLKVFAATLLAVGAMATLASCSNISQSYADKINEEAKDGDKDYITYDEVNEKLGDEAIDITVFKTGVIIAVKGIKTKEDLQKKIEEESDVEGIVITFVAGNATAAVYKKITKDDLTI